MKALVYTGTIQAGRLHLDNRRAFDAALASWTDGPAVVRVERPTKKRTSPQNRWLHGVAIRTIAEHCGYDRHERERLRYWLLGLCFGTHIGPLGEPVPNVDGTRDLSTTDFSTFMEWIVRWAADPEHGPAPERGLRIPLPNDPVCESIISEDEAA